MTFFPRLNTTEICDNVVVNMTDRCNTKVAEPADQGLAVLGVFLTVVSSLTLACQFTFCALDKGRKYVKCPKVLVIDPEAEKPAESSTISAVLNESRVWIPTIATATIGYGLAVFVSGLRSEVGSACQDVADEVNMDCQVGLGRIANYFDIK